MGVPVVVDSDDLETLLMATGVVRAVEAAVQAADRDVQFKMAKPKITAAHDRLGNAWRGAIRMRDMPQIVRDPTEVEKLVLLNLARIGATHAGGIECPNAPLYSRFVGMALAEIGPLDERVVFNSGSGDVYNHRSLNQRLRLRPRAIEMLPKDWRDGERANWTIQRSRFWLDQWEREQIDPDTGHPRR